MNYNSSQTSFSLFNDIHTLIFYITVSETQKSVMVVVNVCLNVASAWLNFYFAPSTSTRDGNLSKVKAKSNEGGIFFFL